MLLRLFSFFILLLFFSCNTQNGKMHQDGNTQHTYTNQLINESSPYLLQHAHNPVNWHPWNEAALQKAKDQNKMLLISVGYAACHWCHVMEHESFEDTTVARIMNEHFIPIKVDREERPDVDDVYMTACHLATNRSCGWPLNAFALPNGRPVWAGTYFPKKQWMEILTYFQKLKEEEPHKLEEYANQITEGIQQNNLVGMNESDQSFTSETIQNITDNFLKNIDFKKGGRQNPPKFPMPNNYEFLLKYHHLFGDEKALEAVTVTLDNIAMGGIYDHLGGGFARYSTDGEWKVPHFEKMMYDNGQIVSIYSKAFLVTKNPMYQQRVEETLEWVKREMTSPEGGFYSSLDADSEGEEGKFYVWEKMEIDSLLADATLETVFNDYYEIAVKGNWEHRKNILYQRKSNEEMAKKHQISEEQLQEILAKAKSKLLKEREKRVRPGLDDKVLTSWNALMLEGYVDAYKAFGKKEYFDAALRNGEFLLKNMLQEDNRLNRNYKDGKSVINAFLDDYALTVSAFMALYEVTFDEKWLNKAKDLTDYAITHFYDKASGMFFYTSDIDPPLITRRMETSDNVIPGSNSVMARDLYYLGLYFYNNDYLEMAKQMMHNMNESLVDNPQPNFYSNWLNLYLDLVKPTFEVAVVGKDFKEKQEVLFKNYMPDAILLGGKDEGSLELLKGKLQEGETMIYVCQNKVCKLPVVESEKAIELMKR